MVDGWQKSTKGKSASIHTFAGFVCNQRTGSHQMMQILSSILNEMQSLRSKPLLYEFAKKYSAPDDINLLELLHRVH